METVIVIAIIVIVVLAVASIGLVEKAQNDVVGDYLDGKKRDSWFGPLYWIYEFYWKNVEKIH